MPTSAPARTSRPAPAPDSRLEATILRAEPSKRGTHIEYTIKMTQGGRSWQSLRRYSEFVNLNVQLKRQYDLLRLPPKGLFGLRQKLDLGSFRVKRLDALRDYLEDL